MLFIPVVPAPKLHPSFVLIQTLPGKAPARAALSNIYSTFTDPDGNFLREFQSTSFDARLFELYLFAYFTQSGFFIDRTHARPDFLVTRDGLTVAVEATTTNPSQGGVLAQTKTAIDDLTSPEEITEYTEGELAIRMSRSLLEKVKAEYWKEKHVSGKPLVVAVQTFHDKSALQMTESALTQYLYGIRAVPRMSDAGTLDVDSEPIDRHRKATLEVPSGFFEQPGTEQVSAVLFTNAGTVAKFSRMGYQSGAGRDIVHMIRRGMSFDPEPSAMFPRFFEYNLDDAPRVETWGEGLSVVHNPKALHPIPNGFFPDAADTRLIDGAMVSTHPSWHPCSSSTSIIYDRHKARKSSIPTHAPVEIGAIPKHEFRRLVKVSPLAQMFYREEAWLIDSTASFLGVIVFDRKDGDWGYSVFGPDETGWFRPIDMSMSLTSRFEAGLHVWKTITDLLRQPQQVFPQ